MRGLAALISPASADHSMLALPTRSATLIASRRLPLTPAPALHTAVVSDTHAVCSQPDPPARPATLQSVAPSLPPCTLTRDDPVVAPVFVNSPLERLGISYVAPFVNDPTALPTLICTTMLPSSPAATLHTTNVSDHQFVPVAPVLPTRPHTLYLPPQATANQYESGTTRHCQTTLQE